MEDIYGVLEYNKEDSLLLVEMLKSKEVEEIEGPWLKQQILDGKIDISTDKESISFYKKEFLSKHLPTSS